MPDTPGDEVFLARDKSCFREPTPVEIEQSVGRVCFTHGLPNPYTGELPSHMPSDEEVRLRTFAADDTKPESWREVARVQAAELLRQRRIQGGLDNE